MVKKKWSDLSNRSRRLIVAAGVIEAGLRVTMLIDIRRRPEESVVAA